MKMKYFPVLICILFNVSLYSSEIKKITLDEAILIAFENNHDYKIAEIKLRQVNEKVNAVWGELFPVLESEASLIRQNAEKGFMSLSDGQYDIKLIQMRFGINPGIFYNSLQTTRRLYIIASEDIKKIKSDIELQVIKGYFSVIVSEEMIRLRKDSIDLLKTNLKDVEKMYSTGSIARFDLLQTRVQLNSQYPLLIEAESSYRTALDYFNYTLGSDKIVTADSSILEKKTEKISGEDRESKIEVLASAALKNRPELIQVRKKIESSEYLGNMYDSYYVWPTFTAGGYYGMTKNDPNGFNPGFTGPIQPDFSQLIGDNQWQKTWQVRAAATYRWGSLFGIDSNGYRSREEELLAKEGSEELQRLKRLIEININACYSKLVAASLTIISQKENVDTATEGLRIARESFRAGIIKNSDLLSSEFALTTARTGYINAVNSYYIALAELKRETGLKDDSIIFGSVRQ